jgi:hypothetical protein
MDKLSQFCKNKDLNIFKQLPKHIKNIFYSYINTSIILNKIRDTKLWNDIINTQKIKLPLLYIPKGTILFHVRDSFFPNKTTHPGYLYNWFSSTPFWGGGDFKNYVIYKYEVNNDITNLLFWTDKDIIDNDINFFRKLKIKKETTAELYKRLYPDIKIDESNDYALAAFAIQILNLNGLVGVRNNKYSPVLDRK